MTREEFTTMLNGIINVGWSHYDESKGDWIDITDDLKERAKDEKRVAKFFDRCKDVSSCYCINIHDAVYHQLHRGNF